MKTAEEWDKEGVAYAADARKIQLDAMQECARIARVVGCQFGDYDPDRDGRIVGNAIEQAILTDINKLKEQQ